MFHSIIARVKLGTQLVDFDLARLQKFIALLPLFLQLEDPAAEPVEVLQHDQPLDIRQSFFSILVERVRFLLFAEGRADNVLNALRREELVLDELQVGLVPRALHIGHVHLLSVEARAVNAADGASLGFGAVTSVFGRAAAEIAQTVVVSVELSSGLGHLRCTVSIVDSALGFHFLG